MMSDVERTVDQHDEAAGVGVRTLAQMREVWHAIISAMRDASPDVRVAVIRVSSSGTSVVLASTGEISIESPPLWLARGIEQHRRAPAARFSIPLEGGGSVVHMREALRADELSVVVFALAPADLRVGRLDGASLLDLACSAPASMVAMSERDDVASRLASVHAIATAMERIHATDTLADAATELTTAAADRVSGGATLATVRRDSIERILPDRALTDESARLIRSSASSGEVRQASGMTAIPMRDGVGVVFAVLLVTASDASDAETLDWLCLLAAAASGPTARLTRAAMSPARRARDQLNRAGRWLVGPDQGVVKVAMVVVAILAGALWLVRVPMEATGHGVVAPRREHVVAAAVSEPLASIEVGPGDAVRAGEVLARHDTSEREVSLEETRAEIASIQRRINAALDADDEAIASELRARLRSFRAEASLLEASIESGVLRAPTDGVVAMAPESAALGVTPRTGDVLFRISAGDERVVRARMSGAEARRISPGMDARFSTVASPDDWMTGIVVRADRIGRDGAFVVEMSFSGVGAPIGLEGEMRTTLGHERLAMRVARPLLVWWRTSIPL